MSCNLGQIIQPIYLVSSISKGNVDPSIVIFTLFADIVCHIFISLSLSLSVQVDEMCCEEKEDETPRDMAVLVMTYHPCKGLVTVLNNQVWNAFWNSLLDS